MLNPASLGDWPEELLEGECFPACLARLLAWTRLQEWMDTAPAAQEGEFRRQLERASHHCHWLEQHQQNFLPVQAWFWREKARLVGFLGGDQVGLELAQWRHQIPFVTCHLAGKSCQPRGKFPSLRAGHGLCCTIDMAAGWVNGSRVGKG